MEQLMRTKAEALNHAAAGFAVILNYPDLPKSVRSFVEQNYAEALAAARATETITRDHDYEPGAYGVCRRCGGEKHGAAGSLVEGGARG